MDPPMPVAANRSPPNAMLMSWLVIEPPLRRVQVIPSGDVATTPVNALPVLFEPTATNPFVDPPYATPHSEPVDPVERSIQVLPSAELRMRHAFCWFCVITNVPPKAIAVFDTPTRS